MQHCLCVELTYTAPLFSLENQSLQEVRNKHEWGLKLFRKVLPARDAEIAQGKADRAVHNLCSRCQNGRKLKINELLLRNEEIMPCCNDKKIPIHYFVQ